MRTAIWVSSLLIVHAINPNMILPIWLSIMALIMSLIFTFADASEFFRNL